MDQNDNPFIERPDEHSGTGNELYCWLPSNESRQCGGDCVAFLPPIESEPMRTTCIFLETFRSAAASLRRVVDVTKERKIAAQIKARQELAEKQPMPPEVK